MIFNAYSGIEWTWAGLGVLWLVGYAFTKRTLRAQSLVSRLFYVALATFAFAFLGTNWFNRGWLAFRIVPDAESLRMAGFLLTLAGALFASWARLKLGANWSGRPSVKAGHELIVRGPYALTRHPIYTGLLFAVAGTALAEGEWRALIGFVLLFVALAAKSVQEEQLMMQTFPDTYASYRQRVKALIPGVL